VTAADREGHAAPAGTSPRSCGLAQHVRGGKDTVNAALREVLEHWRLALALIRLRGTVADGAFDLALLQDKLTIAGDRRAVPH
jgi:hypothetical protein